MMRIIFGAILGVLVAYPTLFVFLLSVVAALISQPVMLAFAAGVLLWPRISRRIRGWAQ
ncbi:hypothetical protein [Streptomyces sp. YKOK-I1]